MIVEFWNVFVNKRVREPFMVNEWVCEVWWHNTRSGMEGVNVWHVCPWGNEDIWPVTVWGTTNTLPLINTAFMSTYLIICTQFLLKIINELRIDFIGRDILPVGVSQL